MLTESFIASTLRSEKTKGKTNKDICIHQYDFQPVQAIKATFKNDSTKQNCLAVSDSHIFAAQADKSVVHVYSRDRGNQEAVVPFPDRIRSLALVADADGGGVLALGTEGGGMILWELCTGRQVPTPPSHLHPTTCLAVDPTSNFVLSGSPDSNIHVWSVPSLLAFSASFNNDPNQPCHSSPIQTLANHRAAINAIEIGHSASKSNIAVSASQDSTCIVWDYMEGILLHTFLLPSAPLCLALDPVDRSFCAGYSDGSIQLVDFYANHSVTNALHDPAQQSMPTQPPSSDRWSPPNGPPSAALTIQYSYDGTVLLSGHESGTVHTWDTANGQYGSQAIELRAPVTNLKILPPTGFLTSKTRSLKTHTVIKPRYETMINGANASSHVSIPADYTFTAQLVSTLHTSHPTPFDLALSSPLFPPSLISASLASFNRPPSPPRAPPELAAKPKGGETDLATQNQLLLSQLETALTHQRTAIKQVLQLERERYERNKQDEWKASRKRKRRLWRMELEQQKRDAVMKKNSMVGKGENSIMETEHDIHNGNGAIPQNISSRDGNRIKSHRHKSSLERVSSSSSSSSFSSANEQKQEKQEKETKVRNPQPENDHHNNNNNNNKNNKRQRRRQAEAQVEAEAEAEAKEKEEEEDKEKEEEKEEENNFSDLSSTTDNLTDSD